jgi:hypothetical protein
MFSLEEYKSFIQSQVIGKVFYHKKDVTDLLLEALFQFEVSPGTYLKDMTDVSRKYKTIFNLSNKKSSIHMNTWFLQAFGYKYCNKCKDIKSLEYYATNKAKISGIADYCKSCNNSYYEIDPDKKKILNRNYKVSNAGKVNAATAKRRAAKLLATPKWLTPEQAKQIEAFYVLAKELESITGIKHHVDHIVSLQGANVLGLHVPWNLQVIKAEDNIRKGNRLV